MKQVMGGRNVGKLLAQRGKLLPIHFDFGGRQDSLNKAHRFGDFLIHLSGVLLQLPLLFFDGFHVIGFGLVKLHKPAEMNEFVAHGALDMTHSLFQRHVISGQGYDFIVDFLEIQPGQAGDYRHQHKQPQGNAKDLDANRRTHGWISRASISPSCC